MAKWVVTGGAGFIGSNLVTALVERGHEVAVLDNYAAGKRQDRISGGVVYHEVDILDATYDWNPFAGADVVVHLAALPRVEYSIQNPEQTMLTNVMGTTRVLHAAHKAGVKKVVYAASSSAYGDQEKMPLVETMEAHPKSPYAFQKHTGERLCALWNEIYSLPVVSLRFFSVYGPMLDADGDYALVIGKFWKQKRQKLPLTITGDGKQTRDFTHVSDVVRAIILAAESSETGKAEVINIGAGRGVSVNALAKLVGGPVVYLPARLESRHTAADISKARRLLGWEPSVSLEDGVADLLRRNA